MPDTSWIRKEEERGDEKEAEKSKKSKTDMKGEILGKKQKAIMDCQKNPIMLDYGIIK